MFGDSLMPITILMDFPDYKYTELEKKERKLINNRRGAEFTRELYAKVLFSPDSYTAYNGEELMSANKFFQLESGGTFSLKGGVDDIYGWLTADKPMAYYGKNLNKKGDKLGAENLAREAIDKLVEMRVDFSRYDGNKDGIIDQLVIIFAGRGEQFENSQGSNSIWPHYNTFSDVSKGPYAYFKDHEGRKWMADRFTLIPQDIPLDLYIHELNLLLHSLNKVQGLQVQIPVS